MNRRGGVISHLALKDLLGIFRVFTQRAFLLHASFFTSSA